AKRHHSAISQCSARPILIADSTPVALTTGSAPGRPRQTGQVWVFGSAPRAVAQPQNILVRVPSSTWTSRPMTGSYDASASSYDTRSVVVVTVKLPSQPSRTSSSPSRFSSRWRMARPVTMAAADTVASIRTRVSFSSRAFLTRLATPTAPNAVAAMDRYVPDRDFLKPLALVSALTATEPP